MYGPMKQPETIPHENDIMFTMIEIFMVAKTYESITKSIQSERVSSIWRDALKFFFTTGTRSTETADADVRTDMNVEDEYFSAIEDRDTAIMKKDQELKQRESELKQKESEIKQKDKDLKQKDEDLKQKDEDLKQKDLMLKAMVNAMIEKGMSIQDISLLVNKDVAFLEELIK